LCNNTASSKRFTFSIPQQNSATIRGYKSLFEVAAIKKLQKLAKVTVLRISKLHVI